MAAKRERFSLLLLEPGEIYFEDFAVHHYPVGLPEHEAMQRKRKGRLKVCSKSLVFDPSEMIYPIIKFPLRDCTTIDQWKGSLMSKLDTKGAVVAITCNYCIEMLPSGIIKPYTTIKKTERYLFSLIYGSIDDCIPQICQLHRASTLSAGDQASMIGAIVHSRHSSVKFNPCWLQDLQETIVLEKYGSRISPLVTNPGLIVLTSLRLYFQPFNNAEAFPVLKIKLEKITRIVKRRFLLRHVGIELFCSEDNIVPYLFFSLNSREERDSFHNALLAHPKMALQDAEQENMLLRWQNRKISNYDYLLYLNSLADRSFNDLAQYPVFPWVIADFSSSELDLSNSDTFRDLTKPVGALNEERLQKLKLRYNDMPDPKFLYGSHYSTPGFILYYLVRKVPQLMLCLQSGRFDHPDRMFNSVVDTWKNITSNSSDFKEAIPEFYQPENKGDFLINSLNIDFGACQDGSKIGDVVLPPWAKDPKDFIQKMRDALETEYVSLNLHYWIDLIFGYKQQGEEAEKADNVFYHLTYEGSVDLDNIKDLNERYALEVQIMEFGQVPKQIFHRPHPSRNSVKHPEAENVGEPDPLSPKHQESWHKINEMEVSHAYQFHKETIRAVCFSQDGRNLYSVSQDGLLKMYSVEDNKLQRSITITNMALSSMKLMADGKIAVIGSWDNNVYAYNFEFGKISSILRAHDDAVSDIFLSEKTLATSSWDSTVKLWNYTPDMQFKRTFDHLLLSLDHDTRVTCLTMNASNSLLLSGTDDGQLCLWDIESQCLVHQFAVDTSLVYSVDFSPDGQRFICCGHDLQMFDINTKSRIFQDYPGEEISGTALPF
uniref:WD repeat-containing protein 55 homolog n=1 Tax=Strigamia maritima TaxID=126957 RepID=T1JHX1_STRMM